MSDIREALKNVPEIQLRIIQLTNELYDEKTGQIDTKKAGYNAKEIDAALDEAESYCSDVQKAVDHLRHLAEEHT